MSITVSNKAINRYFRLRRNWDTHAKKELISRLTASMDEKKQVEDRLLSCFGAWKDTRSADEIIGQLQKDRTNQREIEDF